MLAHSGMLNEPRWGIGAVQCALSAIWFDRLGFKVTRQSCNGREPKQNKSESMELAASVGSNPWLEFPLGAFFPHDRQSSGNECESCNCEAGIDLRSYLW